MFIGVFLAALLFLFLIIGGPAAFFWKGRRATVLRSMVAGYPALALVLVFGLAPYWLAKAIAHAGTRPMDARSNDDPERYGLTREDISFEAADGVNLRGWFVAPHRGRAVIIGSHGLFRNRVELLARLVPACKAGYGVLLYDSRSHGTSSRAIVSFGYYERNDVLGAMQYVERHTQADSRPAIVLMGVSMGAVATLEAASQSTTYDALILDSPFSNLRQTVGDHVRLFLGLPRFPFANLFLFWYSRIAGFDPGQFDAHVALRKVKPVPLLIIGSEGDERNPSGVARSLYEESPAPVKRLKIFGADVPHGASARLHPQEYWKVLHNFLSEAFPGAAPSIKPASAGEGFPR
jgi:dipeptidyl aminopeptidase/acylaminoacyl peptidase